MSHRRGTGALVVAVMAVTIAALVGGPASADLPGCSNCITAGDIAAGAVRASELNDDLDDSLSANDLAPGSVSKSEVATGAVGSLEIVDGSVRTVDFAMDVADRDRFYASHLVDWLRISAEGSLVAEGTPNDFTGHYSYEPVPGRYRLSILAPLDQIPWVVTPMCPNAASWYTTYQIGDGISDGTIFVHIRDVAGAPVQCEFSLILG